MKKQHAENFPMLKSKEISHAINGIFYNASKAELDQQKQFLIKSLKIHSQFDRKRIVALVLGALETCPINLPPEVREAFLDVLISAANFSATTKKEMGESIDYLLSDSKRTELYQSN